MFQHLQCSKAGKTPLLQEQPRFFMVTLPLRPRAAKSATNTKTKDAGALLCWAWRKGMEGFRPFFTEIGLHLSNSSCFQKSKSFFCLSNGLEQLSPLLHWRTVYCILHVNKRHYTAQSHCSKAHLQLQISLLQSWSDLGACSDPFSLVHCIKQSEMLANSRDISLIKQKVTTTTKKRGRELNQRKLPSAKQTSNLPIPEDFLYRSFPISPSAVLLFLFKL